MTQEEKLEKAKVNMDYKERLEKAKELYPTANADQRYVLECLFPELAESEDERIRKSIISGLKYLETELGWDAVGDVDILDAYAWLEKQGETYTKKDVDDAYLKGVCDAKQELEKQGEQKLANSAKTCKKSQRMVSAEAKEALYDKPATIDIDKMVDDYANNEEFGKPLNCMVRAYRQGLKDAIGKVVSESAWSEED